MLVEPVPSVEVRVHAESFVAVTRDEADLVVPAFRALFLKGAPLFVVMEALQNPCSQVELNKIVPFGFSLQRQKNGVFFAIKIV